MKIGLISDTHSYIDDTILNYLKGSDEIWHAGDIGDINVINKLEAVAPIKAVFGNIDDIGIRSRFPENNFITIDNLRILITHIAGTPPNFNPRVKALLNSNPVDVIICGHSHILKVTRDPSNGLIYINPGAAGVHGFHRMRTIMTFEIVDGKLANMKVIELGLRGKIDR
jgi:uncharacterized protein